MKFVTGSFQKVAHTAIQVGGGIGYTDVYPVERHVRDLHLASDLDQHRRGDEHDLRP